MRTVLSVPPVRPERATEPAAMKFPEDVRLVVTLIIVPEWLGVREKTVPARVRPWPTV